MLVTALLEVGFKLKKLVPVGFAAVVLPPNKELPVDDPVVPGCCWLLVLIFVVVLSPNIPPALVLLLVLVVFVPKIPPPVPPPPVEVELAAGVGPPNKDPCAGAFAKKLLPVVVVGLLLVFPKTLSPVDDGCCCC